jgi:hypothetical protein
MKTIWIPQTLAGVMLLWALKPDNPYGYYILLRWVCCGVFAYLAFQALEQEKQEWVWILGIIALIYNPIFRVHLNRELWSIINIATIGVAVVSIFTLRKRQGTRETRDGP